MTTFYEYGLTEEDYKIAEANGITRKLAYSRVHNNYWEIERAITQKPRTSPIRWNEFKELALANGVTYGSFKWRVEKGMDHYLSATTPMVTKEEKSEILKSKRKFPHKYYETAKKNGIPVKTFYARVTKCGWSLKDACTIPVIKDMGKRSEMKAKDKKSA